MRPDMAKIIVERPRKGGGVKYPRARDHRLANNDFLDAPTREPYKSRHFTCTKWLNENLAPLRRFLRSNLGRPWREVHAEIAAQVPRDSTIHYHVWQHLQWEVEENTFLVDGAAWCFGRYGGPDPCEGFYVYPLDGTLREARDSKRIRKLRALAAKPFPDRFIVSRFLEYHRIHNIWYAYTFTLAPSPDVPALDPEVQKLLPPSTPPKRFIRAAFHKRQLNKLEIKSEITPRLRQFLLDREHAQTQLAHLPRPARRRAFFWFIR